jgi:hypothetical protein
MLYLISQMRLKDVTVNIPNMPALGLYWASYTSSDNTIQRLAESYGGTSVTAEGVVNVSIGQTSVCSLTLRPMHRQKSRLEQLEQSSPRESVSDKTAPPLIGRRNE